MNKNKNLRLFTLISFFYCLLMAFIFQPITWQAQGDATAYIELSKQFLNISNDNVDLSGRQPLYSLLLALFILIFGETDFLYPIMYFQFLLVFISSIFIYKIFSKISISPNLPWIAGIAYLINFSTLYYGFNILTETLSLLLFIVIVYLIQLSIETKNIWIIIFLGLANGLLVLARFNAIGIPIITFISLLLIHYKNYSFSNIRGFLKKTAVYIIPLLFILNIWCVFNYVNRGFYGLFPSYHAGQRWAIPATINENNSVSSEYKPLLEIFLNAKAEYIKSNPPAKNKKGSLLGNDLLRYIYYAITPEINGYRVYRLAEKEILMHFKLENKPEDIAKLGMFLKPFYNEIEKQNAALILQYRVYSFTNTFRASATTLPVKDKINLNILPGYIFQAYKVLFLGISILTYLFAGIYLLFKTWKIKKGAGIGVLILSLFIWYFPIIHFYANVLSDANRFKFPAEPLILGLFFYFIFAFSNLIGQKMQSKNLTR